jgi:hypothetical protein
MKVPLHSKSWLRDQLPQGSRGKRHVDDLNGYVILAGVLLIWAVLAYAVYTDLMSRLRKRKAGRREKSVSRRRRQEG